MLSTVVLPAPFGPMTDMISPRGTSNATLVTAWTPPKDFETSWISRIASLTSVPSPEESVARAAPALEAVGTLRQPSLSPPVVFDVPVTLSLPDAGQAQ